ncbi:MAG TPA: tetratricopeptide repeat protein [Stellaceae bacterium]|nr:tetratricopeptide repeat protein [Stellaceae bacterium]
MSEISPAAAADTTVTEALAHRDAGRWPQAIEQFRRALERHPNDARLLFELGECYRHSGDRGRAIQAFERAITLDADIFPAYRSAVDAALAQAATLGASSTAAGDLKKFAAKYLVALGQRQQQQRAAGAEESFRAAAALDPKSAAAYAGLGELLEAGGHYGEAEKALRRAIALDPKLGAAHIVLGNALQSLGRFKEMEAAYRHALAIDPMQRAVRESLLSVPLMHLLYDAETTPAQICARHREWGDWAVAEARAAAPTAPPFANSRDPERRLRVAFLSPDLRYHAVSFFFEPLLAHHDPAVVEVYCYAEVEKPDFVTVALQKVGGIWRNTHGNDDPAVRAQLRADRIDIAIDLAGHTGHSRLNAFAIKPAPVTATWLGYAATTGLPTIDWRITDARADPPGQEQFHSEKLLRLAETFLCYHFYGAVMPEVMPLPAAARGAITFGSFNNPLKLSPPAIAAWARILDQVPGSRLVLKSLSFVEPTRKRHFLERFAAQGISAERLVLRDPQPDLTDHLKSYAEIDIALDPFPYNGTTTTCEAMSMGVPMVTLVGDRHASRVGFDLLSQVGLAEFAAPDRDAYVAAAVTLARDLPRLVQLRSELRERMRRSSLCDAPRFARAFEAGLREMWRRWCGSA